MGRNHLKRLAIPRSWELPRKATKYIIRQAPGPHSLAQSLPLGIVLRDLLGIAKTAREVRYVLQQREILVDGKRRREPHFAVGPMDIVAIPATQQYFRMTIKADGTLHALPIADGEQHKKLARIVGKRMRDAKHFQLTLSDGRTLTAARTEKVQIGDSMLLELPGQKPVAQYPLTDGAAVYLFGGSHCGSMGTVQKIQGNMIHIRTGSEHFQTPKEYVFVVGKEKPAVQVSIDG